MTEVTVFIAGIIQGNRITELINQDYRTRIASIVEHVLPSARIYDPSVGTASTLASLKQFTRESMFRDLTTMAITQTVQLGSMYPQLKPVTEQFLRETQMATECSLCIAYLPDFELSMGTAMEMYAAKTAGKPVITITNNVGNLAILSTSDIIVADLSRLPQALDMILTEQGFKK